MVGDRLDTDVMGGINAGLKTYLVLTGVSTRQQAESAPKHMQPDCIIEDLSGLLK
jgi:ribonucleotide monophosphatase NagD (HAD superfamily)